ncbi:MAG: type I 3-dehydroquinate dehydratase [Candidatus Magnetoovum sp. WYHC-5]|nr:type I 3-dehydroquinate dehydratase [Candidatus Magnetoovum sp. WYHC-5]
MINIGNLTLTHKPIIVVPFKDSDVTVVNNVHIIELRIDMFKNMTSIHNTFTTAKSKYGLPIIATFRAPYEGGLRIVSEEERFYTITNIIDICDAVDIEINAPIAKQTIDITHEYKKTSIASFHNFNSTPDIKELEHTFSKGKALGAQIIKIAVMPNNSADLRTITAFTINHCNDDIVTIAMGKLGRASRILLHQIGSLFTFAAIDTVSAPGQMSVDELNKFFI